MRIDANAIWVTTDPGPHSTLPDVCFETPSAAGPPGRGGPRPRSGDAHSTRGGGGGRPQPAPVWRIAHQIRIDRRLPEGEVVRVTLHDAEGQVVWKGDVR